MLFLFRHLFQCLWKRAMVSLLQNICVHQLAHISKSLLWNSLKIIELKTMKQLVKVSQMKHIEWQLIKDLGIEPCAYTLTCPRIRLPICQPQSAAGRSLLTQCCQAECHAGSCSVTSGSCLSCVLLAKDAERPLALIFTQLSNLQSLPSLPGSCLFFTHSFPGSSIPNLNSL